MKPKRRFKMKYRGNHYTIVQGVGTHPWRWTVYLNDKIVKSGAAVSRDAADYRVVCTIDNALAPRKVKLEQRAA